MTLCAAVAATQPEPEEEEEEEEEEVTRTGLKLRRVTDLPKVQQPKPAQEKTAKEKERDLKRQRLEEAAKMKKEENLQRKELEAKRKPKITLTGKPNRKVTWGLRTLSNLTGIGMTWSHTEKSLEISLSPKSRQI